MSVPTEQNAQIGDLWRCGCGQEWIEDGEGAQHLPAQCGVCGRDMVHIGPLPTRKATLAEEEFRGGALLDEAVIGRVSTHPAFEDLHPLTLKEGIETLLKEARTASDRPQPDQCGGSGESS